MKKFSVVLLVLMAPITLASIDIFPQRIQPEDLVYMGAFRLPENQAGSGARSPWEPQPYAVLNIDQHLFNIASEQQKQHVKAACFDRIRGFLYIFEYRADGDKPLIHVWKVGSDSNSETPSQRKKKAGIHR